MRDQPQACAPRIVDHGLGADAFFHGRSGTAAFQPEVDDANAACRFQRGGQIAEQWHPLIDLVIRVDYQDDIERPGGELWIAAIAEDRLDVHQAFGVDAT